MITYDDVIKSMEKAIALKGADYVYPDSEKGVTHDNSLRYCRYSKNDGTASCLAGYVLADLDPEAFVRARDMEMQQKAPGPAWPLLGDSGLYTEKAKSALGWAQNLQDGGMAWGVTLQKVKDNPYLKALDD